MTRKEALQEAINLIQKSSIGKARKAEILAGLNGCHSELPFTKWSETAIFDACDQFVKDHGSIRLVDFSHAGLPSHPTIKNRFGMNAKEFRDTYYPLPEEGNTAYSTDNATFWNEKFRAEFHRTKCTSAQRYNTNRDKQLPTHQTLERMNEVDTWRELLDKLGLKTYGEERPALTVTILPPPQKKPLAKISSL